MIGKGRIRVLRKLSILQAGGFSACSRWLSEERATPPDPRRTTHRMPEVCQPRADANPRHPALAPLPGCESFRVANPVVSLRSTTGYRLLSLRDTEIPRFSRDGVSRHSVTSHGQTGPNPGATLRKTPPLLLLQLRQDGPGLAVNITEATRPLAGEDFLSARFRFCRLIRPDFRTGEIE